MNSKLCKKIRKYVKKTYLGLPQETRYMYNPLGEIIVSSLCFRGRYLLMKRRIKASKERVVHANW